MHMLETMPFVVAVRHWEELPAVLAAAMPDAESVVARQRAMARWLSESKARTFRELLLTVRMMKAKGAGSWRPRTTCVITDLSPFEVADQHARFADYWRRPQPLNASVWNPSPFGKPVGGRPFKGPGSFCEDESQSEDFTEDCLTAGCGLPYIFSYDCMAWGELPQLRDDMPYHSRAWGQDRQPNPKFVRPPIPKRKPYIPPGQKERDEASIENPPPGTMYPPRTEEEVIRDLEIEREDWD